MKQKLFITLSILCSAMAIYAEENNSDRTWWDKDNCLLDGECYYIEEDVVYDPWTKTEYRLDDWIEFYGEYGAGIKYGFHIENKDRLEVSITAPFVAHATEPDNFVEKHIILPDRVEHNGKTYSVTAIQNSPAFRANRIELPSSIRYISSNNYSTNEEDSEYSIYDRCKAEFIFNEGLETIMDNVFFRADISSLKLPGSLRSIGSDFAGKCRNLESVDFNEGLISIGENALSDCPRITEIDLPSTLLTLGRNSFNSCENLEKLHISRWIRNRNGFEGIANNCPNIKEIVYDSNTPYPAVNSFNKVNKEECTLYVPYRRGYVYAQTEGWKEFRNIVEMDELTTALHPADVAQNANSTTDEDVYTTLEGIRYEEWNEIPSNTIIIHKGQKVLKR